MKRSAKVIVWVVVVGVTFVVGMMVNEHLIFWHCANDPQYTKIGGVEWVCIDRAQFEFKFLSHGDKHGSNT